LMWVYYHLFLRRYYLAQQVHPVVSRLCDPLEGTDASRLALCLGLDPNDYKGSNRGSEAAEAERNAWRSEEERFRDCEKLKVIIGVKVYQTYDLNFICS